MLKEYGIGITESENMIPFEREIYYGQIMQDIERRRRATKGANWSEVGA